MKNRFSQFGMPCNILKKNDNGFTLVELFIVMGILTLLAVLALPTLSDVTYRVKVARAQVEIRSIEKDIFAYVTDKNSLPDSLADIGRNNLLDPWGNQYQYYNVAKLGGAGAYVGLVPLADGNLVVNTDFDLYSLGKNGHTGKSTVPTPDADSKDDIIRASDGSFIGLADSF